MAPYPGVMVMCVCERQRETVKCSNLLRAVVAHMYAHTVLSIAYMSAVNQGRAVKTFK